jgi:hypothetical protein
MLKAAMYRCRIARIPPGALGTLSSSRVWRARDEHAAIIALPTFKDAAWAGPIDAVRAAPGNMYRAVLYRPSSAVCALRECRVSRCVAAQDRGSARAPVGPVIHV